MQEIRSFIKDSVTFLPSRLKTQARRNQFSDDIIVLHISDYVLHVILALEQSGAADACSVHISEVRGSKSRFSRILLESAGPLVSVC